MTDRARVVMLWQVSGQLVRSAAERAVDEMDYGKIVEELFLAALSRLPTNAEREPLVAELTAAKLIPEAANVDRSPNESAFTRYGGLAPIPEWSGSTNGRLHVCR